MKMSTYQETSQTVSSLFAAPSEQMVEQGESTSTLVTPIVPTCPKVEGQKKKYIVSEYYDYWHERWISHPCNVYKCEEAEDVEISQSIEKFDYERFVLLKDLVWKWSNKLRRLPVALPPREIPTFERNGRILEVPYFTFFQGKNRYVDPDHVAYYGNSMVPGRTDPRRRYKFTYSNLEAALRMTRHIWYPRLKPRQGKKSVGTWNWEWLIRPMCVEFLIDLQDWLTGYTKDSAAESNEITERYGHRTYEEKMYDWNHSDEVYLEKLQERGWSEENTSLGNEIIVREDVLEPKEVVLLDGKPLNTEEEPNAAVNHYYKARFENKIIMDVTERHQSEFYAYEWKNRHADKKNPFRWYPVIDITRPKKLRPNPEQRREQRFYFTQLEQVYQRIGRSDLAERIRLPVRQTNFRRRVARAIHSSQRLEWMRREPARMPEDHPLNYLWEPQSGVSYSTYQEHCYRKHRDRIHRILTQQLTLFARHRDKMSVLVNPPPNAEYDIKIFVRQKRILGTISYNENRAYLTELQSNISVNLPKQYLQQACSVLHYVEKAVMDISSCEKTIHALAAVNEIVTDWYHADFDPNRCKCVERTPQSAVSDGPPKLGAAPAPQAAGGPTAEEGKDIPVKKGEKMVNMTMVDARPMDKTKVPEEKTGIKTTSSNQEPSYKYQELFERPQMVKKVTWTTGMEMAAPLYAAVLPSVYFGANTKEKTVCANLTAATVFSMFGSVKFDMKARVVINSTKFQQGRLIVYFKPYYDKSRGADVFGNATQFPHFFIDATSSSPGEITIPWTNFRNAFPIYCDPHNEYNYFGTLNIQVWNPLMTGQTGSTDATLTIWMWLENVETYTLVNPKDPSVVDFATDVRGVSETTDSGVFQTGKTQIATIKEWEPQALVGNLIDAGVGLAADASVGLLENLLNRISRGGNDKPFNVNPPGEVITQTIANPSHGVGIDHSNRLSLSPLCQSKPDIERTPPANIYDLISKKSRVAVATWKTTDEENARIYHTPIMPMLPATTSTTWKHTSLYWDTVDNSRTSWLTTCKNTPGSASATIINRKGTMLDYLSRMFYYWRGSLKWELEIVCTGMHTGRLLVRYEPYGMGTQTVDECQKLATPGVTWDIQEKTRTLEFSTPYMSVQDWNEAQYVSDGGTGTDIQYSMGNGVLEITVVNKLKVTTGISGEVQINVYQSAGDDFLFACLAQLDGIHSIRSTHMTWQATTSDTTFNQLDRLYHKLAVMAGRLEQFNEDVVKEEYGTEGVYHYEGSFGKQSRTALLHCQKKGAQEYTHKELLDIISDRWIDYAQQAENLKLLDTDTSNSLQVPTFSSHKEAYNWLRQITVRLPTVIQKAVVHTKLYPTGHEMQKMLWYYALCLYPTALTKLKAIPTVPTKTGILPAYVTVKYVSAPKPESLIRVPQSVENQGVNPFLGHVPPKASARELMGESFMDLYKICKREQEWMNITMPPSAGDSTSDLAFKMEDRYEKFFDNVSKLGSMELDNYWVRLSIPVTPALFYHSVGMPGHCLVDTKFKSTKVNLANLDLMQLPGHAELGNRSTLTHLAMFAELFTFWRGSLRYMVTFPESTDQNGDSWACEIAYDPRQFTTWYETFTKIDIITDKKRRDISKLGKMVASTNVAGCLKVEVPYYSKYHRLSISTGLDAITDDTTTNGTLYVMVPLRRLSKNICKVDDERIPAVILQGLKMNIWVSVGDDFEFSVPRAAPTQYLWPNYYSKKTDTMEVHDNYATLMYLGNVPFTGHIPEYPGHVVKNMPNQKALEPVRGGPYHSITIMHHWESMKRSYDTSVQTYRMGNFNWNGRTKEGIYEQKEKYPPIDKTKPPRKWEPQNEETKDAPPFSGSGPVGENAGVGGKVDPLKEAALKVDVKEKLDQIDVEAEKAKKNLEDLKTPKSEITLDSSDEIDGFINSLTDAAVKIPKVLEDFCEITSSAKAALAGLNRLSGKAEEALNVVAKETTSASETIKKSSLAMENVARYAFDAARVGVFFHGIINMMRAETMSERWVPLASCALALGLSTEVVTKAGEWLIAHMSSFWSSEKVHENRKPQAYEDKWNESWYAFIEENIGVLRMIAAGTVTLAMFYCTTSAPDNRQVSNFATSAIRKLKNFAIVGSAVKTLDWLFKWIGETIRTAVSAAADWATGGQFTAYKMASHYPEVIEWLKSIEIYKMQDTTTSLTWNAEARMALWKKMDEGEKLMSKITSKSGSLWNTLMRGMMVLQKAHDEALGAVGIAPFREDPFHLCLTGTPGIGKSAILTFIINFVCDAVGLPKKHRFYSRAEDDDYWSGYYGQTVTLIDDIFQDKKGKAIKELIKMKTNMAWPLNMASVEAKGRPFMSKLIGSTTNVPFPAPDDIVCKEALWRRRNVLCKVESNRPKGSEKPWMGLTFTILDPNPQNGAENRMSRQMNLEEFMVFLAETYTEYSKVQRQLVYAGLQGQKMQMPDYGDDEGQETKEVNSVVNLLQFLKDTKKKLSPEMETKLTEAVLEEDKKRIAADPEYYELMMDFQSMDQFRAEVPVECRYAALVKCVKERKFDRVCNEISALRKEGKLKEESLKDSRTMITLLKNDIPFTLVGKILEDRQGPDQFTVVHATWIPQGEDDLVDEMLVDLSRHQDEIISRSESLMAAARQSVKEREGLMQGLEGLIVEYSRVPKRRKEFVVASEKEIKNFVESSFLEYSVETREQIKNDAIKIYNEVKAVPACKEIEVNTKASIIASLFEPRAEKYWKKTEKGSWYMKFPEDAETDEEVELEAAWEIYKLSSSLDDISKERELLLKKTSLDFSQINKLEKFYKNQKCKIMKFFEDHPNVVRIIKIGAALAALFVGYKILNFMCPGVVEKIKVAFAGVFGWMIGKTIGQERFDNASSFVQDMRERTTEKGKQFFETMRAMMRGTKDPYLVEKAETAEGVTQFAEGLEKLVRKESQRGQLREAAINPEARKKIVNAYMLGQDTMHKEGSERKVLTDLEIVKATVNQLPQGATDQGALDFRLNVLQKSLVRVEWYDIRKGSTYAMNGLMIEGRTLLVPYHLFNTCTNGTYFMIVQSNNLVHWDTYHSERAVKLPDQDALLYACGIRVPQFRDITKHFISSNKLNFTKTPATLTGLTLGGLVTTLVEAQMVYEIDYDAYGEKIINKYAWEYEANTQAGDCGSVLLADNTAVLQKILGIHVCGAKGQGIGSAAYISQENLLEALKSLPIMTGVKLVPTNLVPQCLVTKGVDDMKVRPAGNFYHAGAVIPSKAVRLPHKTEIQQSPIFELVREHVSEPAILVRDDPRNITGESPLLRALEKYGKPTLPFQPTDLDYVTTDIRAEVLSWKITMPKRKLTDYEAVFGNEMIEYCDRMNLAASPGYPWTLSRPPGEKGKAYLFDVNAEDGIACDDYRHAYKAREVLARAGIRKTSVWTDCLKDERRPLSKIMKASTRAFMLPPADFVQLCRKYFMAFCVTFYSNAIDSFSAVGIDPYSYDWTRLARKLKRKSNLGFGGDFHSFDGIFDPDILWRIGLIINEWYAKDKSEDFEPEDQVVRMALVEEMIHTVHICLNSVYVKFQGNPSGNPLTVIVNTFAHCYYIRLAWINLAMRNEPAMSSMYMFHKFVEEIYYGDDGLLAVKYDVKEWFNLKTVSNFLREHHIEYTSESKDEELYGLRRVMDCTFLKNGFVKMPSLQLWLAPIAKDTIFELTNWIKKSDDPYAQLRENLENAMMFSYHHGREFFEDFCVRVNKALQMKRLREIPVSFDLEQAKFVAKCGT